MRGLMVFLILSVLSSSVFGQGGQSVAGLKAAAKQGSAEAQNQLGLLYARGEGVEQSDSEAARWIQMAAEQDHAEAAFNLAMLFSLGRGVAADEVESSRWMRVAAEAGLAEAQFQIGKLYNRGDLLRRDNSEARRWMMMAAEQGHPTALEFLGVMYRDGIDVGENQGKALEFFRRAALAGSASSQYAAADMFFKGDGVSAPDYTQAWVFASLAAAQEFPKAAKLRDKSAKKLSTLQRAEAEEQLKMLRGEF